MNAQKMAEFGLQPSVTEYTLDLKGLDTWKSQVPMLRFDFLGLPTSPSQTDTPEALLQAVR